MLLIDAGNSRIKWGWVEGSAILATAAAAREGDGLPEAMLAAWSERHPQRVIVSNVAGPRFAETLRAWCSQRWAIRPEFAAPQRCGYGVDTRYSEPGRLGVDRWLALIAVRDMAPVVVVDCGTAVTLDYLDPSGSHRGGVILPGLRLMQESLYRRAPGIRRESNGRGPGAGELLGIDTVECIEHGSRNAVVGGIEQTVAQWRRAFGRFRLVICGGDAPVIQSLSKEEYHSEPHLVLRGLQIIANSK